MSGCCVSPSFIPMFAETVSLSPSFPIAPAAARGILSEPRSLPVTPLCSAPWSPFSHPGWNLPTYFSYHSLPCPLSPGSTDLLAVGRCARLRPLRAFAALSPRNSVPPETMTRAVSKMSRFPCSLTSSHLVSAQMSSLGEDFPYHLV